MEGIKPRFMKFYISKATSSLPFSFSKINNSHTIIDDGKFVLSFLMSGRFSAFVIERGDIMKRKRERAP